MSFKLGLIVNPVAGLGGSVALKGSDNMTKEALAKGAVPKANLRCINALQALQGLDIEVFCWACLLYTSPSPRDLSTSRMPSSA